MLDGGDVAVSAWDGVVNVNATTATPTVMQL